MPQFDSKVAGIPINNAVDNNVYVMIESQFDLILANKIKAIEKKAKKENGISLINKNEIPKRELPAIIDATAVVIPTTIFLKKECFSSPFPLTFHFRKP